MRQSKKMTAKEFALQKRKRRQWITFVRMLRYGVNNFSRNAWLTVAATAMMTLTLFVIFVSFTARNVLLDTVAQIRDRVTMSMYVQQDASQEDISSARQTIANLEGVTDVQYITPEQYKEEYRESRKEDSRALAALNLADVTFPGVFRVSVEDINNPEVLDNYVKNDELYQKIADPERDPSFAGDRRDAIETIGRWVGFAEKMGLLMSIVLATISSLIVFNTIRMAIFNRKEEIKMMKLIGADKGFIRGPFVVEAAVYGLIAAVVATGLGVALLMAARPKLESYGILIEPTLGMITLYIGFVLLAMIALGAVIGIASSLFATRKYLKI
ncbi:MAG: cell division protein FtsX [Candidatus Saccharimonadales bacterium]